MSRDRECQVCGETIPGDEEDCPNCGTRNGKVGDDPSHPGGWKGYIKLGEEE